MSDDDEKAQKIKNLMVCGFSEREAREYIANEERLHPEPEEEEVETEESEPEETEPEDLVPTRAEIVKKVQEDVIRERKLELLDKLSESLEESEKADGEFRSKQLEVFEAELNRSTFWNSILENPSWEPLLRDIVRFLAAQMRGSIPKLVFTFELDGKTMSIEKVFFDKNGKRVTHELTDDVFAESDEE